MPVTTVKPAPPSPFRGKDGQPPPEKPVDPRPWLRFHLLMGAHVQTDRDGVERQYQFIPGQDPPVIESQRDLVKTMNSPGMARQKFAYADGEKSSRVEAPVTQQRPGESIAVYAERMRKLIEEADRALQQANSAAPPTVDLGKTLDSMSLDDLKKLAAEEEIDLSKVKATVDDYRRAIKAAWGNSK